MILQRRTLAAAPVLALGLLCAQPTAAWQIEWGTGASLEFTDNVRREEANQRSDQIGTLWAGVHVLEDTPTLRLGLSSTLEFQDYQRNSYDDDYLFRLSAQATASLVPQRLHWHLENYFRQLHDAQLDPLTPENRQDVNIFWTGPDAFFRFGRSTELQLGARVGHNYYAESRADNIRGGGSARLIRRMWPRLDGFLHAEGLRVEYEHDEYPSFDRLDLLAGVDYRLRATEIRLEGGHSTVTRDGAEDIDDVLAGIRIRRRLPQDAEAGASYVQQFTESGASLLAAGGDPMRAEMVFTPTPRGLAYERRAEAYYARRLGLVDTRVTLHWLDEESHVERIDRDLVDEDREYVGGRLDLGYRFNAEWLFGAYGSYRQIRYPEIGREDDEAVASLRAEYALGRYTATAVEVLHNRRDSNVPDEQFRENVVLLSLRYGARPPEVPL